MIDTYDVVGLAVGTAELYGANNYLLWYLVNGRGFSLFNVAILRFLL